MIDGTVNSLITANEMQMRTPIFGQIRAQMVVRIDCAHLMRMQKSGCINAAENRTSGTNRYEGTYVHVLYECTVALSVDYNITAHVDCAVGQSAA